MSGGILVNPSTFWIEPGKTFDLISSLSDRTIRRKNAMEAIMTTAMQHPSYALEDRYGARNYAPLPVMLERGEGVWLFDTDGRRYLDMMSAYSAVSFGHSHPKLVAALIEQAGRLTLTSRAFHNVELGPFLADVCRITRMDRA